MNMTEAGALIAYASQIDARVQTNEATVDLWQYALSRVPLSAARAAVREHYATVDGNGRYVEPIGPAAVKRLIRAEQERQGARRAALTAGPPKVVTLGSLRARDPERWDQLRARGREAT